MAALSLLMVLGIAEGLVRALDLGPTSNVVHKENYRLASNEKLQYELIPGSRDGELSISSAGLRDTEYPLPKPPGVFRILVIGDSIAYGFGVAQNEAISEQLERLLGTQHSPAAPRFEVLNLGVTGYNIEQVVESLRTRGLRFAPDLVVYAYCLNDPQAFSLEMASLQHQLSPAQESYREDLLSGGRRFVARSRLWLLARYAVRAVVEPARAGTTPLDGQWVALADGTYAEYFTQLYTQPESLGRLRRGLDELSRLARTARVPLIAAIFPLFVDLDDYKLGPVHHAVRELLRERGVPAFDLLPVYSKMLELHGPVFVHNALHPNATGQRLAALYLLRALERGKSLGQPSISWVSRLDPTETDRLLAGVVERTTEAESKGAAEDVVKADAR